MDHNVIGKGPSSGEVHQYLPHLAHKVGNQILREEYSSKILWFFAQIHPNIDGFSRHIVTRSHLSICYQNQTKI